LTGQHHNSEFQPLPRPRALLVFEMTDDAEAVYDDIAFVDMQFEEEDDVYVYPCPCGDIFVISVEELRQGKQIAHCNGCSLKIRVILDDAAMKLFGLRSDETGTDGGTLRQATHGSVEIAA